MFALQLPTAACFIELHWDKTERTNIQLTFFDVTILEARDIIIVFLCRRSYASTVDLCSKEPGYIFSFCHRILQSQTFLTYHIPICLLIKIVFNDELFLSKRSVVPAFF